MGQEEDDCAKQLKKTPQIFACEPEIANDAAISVKTGKIYHFHESPNSIADGARTLSVSDRTLQYLKKIVIIFKEIWLIH